METPAPGLVPDVETALRGRAPVVAGSGWTIIVGGAVTEAEAEVIAARYRAQGYRTGVLAGVTREGAAVWRVAVGQFGTSGPAGAALRQLRGTLPADAWLLRLR